VSGRSATFALLAENRETLKLLATLFGTSEFLSKILISHPELLESMVSRTYSASVKAREVMDEELSSVLLQADGFEEQLDVLRRYRHEEFLRIGLNDIQGNFSQAILPSSSPVWRRSALRQPTALPWLSLPASGGPAMKRMVS